MFTIKQIEEAHSKVKSGADFPKYIQEIIQLGITGFETFTTDSHTVYYGKDSFSIESEPMYQALDIADTNNKEAFALSLKIHQKGETDYFTFCGHCAEAGVEKWIVDLEKMTCIYFDKNGSEVLAEKIPN